MAEEPINNGTGTPTDTQPNNNGGEQAPKMFTQEELNTIIKDRLNKAKKDMPTDEELKAYNTWKENQKTQQEKDNDKIKQLENNNSTLSNENKYLKAQLEIVESNVKKEFLKFVTSEVLDLTDDTTDVKTALENYKKKNPQYFGDVVVKKTQTAPNLNNGGGQGKTTNDIMNNILRGNSEE